MTGRGREVDGDVQAAAGRGWAVSGARWAWAMARTMARPRPCPSVLLARSAPRRWNGWNSRSTSSAGITGPGVADREPAATADGRDLDAAAADVVAHGVVDEVRDQALDQAWVAGDGGRVERRCDADATPRRPPPRWSRTTSRAMSARSTGSPCSMPRSLLASVSSASIRRSCCGAEGEHLLAGRPQGVGGRVGVGEGDLRAGSAAAVSGVRSSWEALATKCRCDSNDVSSRPNRSSRVAPSSVNSSSAAGRARAAGAGCGGDVAGGRGDRCAAGAGPGRRSASRARPRPRRGRPSATAEPAQHSATVAAGSSGRGGSARWPGRGWCRPAPSSGRPDHGEQHATPQSEDEPGVQQRPSRVRSRGRGGVGHGAPIR